MKDAPVVFKTVINDHIHYYCRLCSQYRPEKFFTPSSIKYFRRRCKTCASKYHKQLYYKNPTARRLACLKNKLYKTDASLASRWEASDIESIYKVANGKSEISGEEGPLCIVRRNKNFPLLPTNAMCILRKEARQKKHLIK